MKRAKAYAWKAPVDLSTLPERELIAWRDVYVEQIYDSQRVVWAIDKEIRDRQARHLDEIKNAVLSGRRLPDDP